MLLFMFPTLLAMLALVILLTDSGQSFLSFMGTNRLDLLATGLVVIISVAAGLLLLVWNRIQRQLMRNRLDSSALAEKLEAGLLTNDPIYRHTPAVFRWIISRPKWGSLGSQPRWDAARLVGNLDWYTQKPRLLIRLSWILGTLPLFILVILIVVSGGLGIYYSFHSPAPAAMAAQQTLLPAAASQTSIANRISHSPTPFALGMLFMQSYFLLMALCNMLPERRRVWRAALLRYLREYVSANQAAASPDA